MSKVDDGLFRAHSIGGSSPATGRVSGSGTSDFVNANFGGGSGVGSSFDSSGGVGGRVLFGSEGSTYKVVQVSSNMCRGLMLGNQSFFKKPSNKCNGLKHAGDGVVALEGEALALANSQ